GFKKNFNNGPAPICRECGGLHHGVCRLAIYCYTCGGPHLQSICPRKPPASRVHYADVAEENLIGGVAEAGEEMGRGEMGVGEEEENYFDVQVEIEDDRPEIVQDENPES